MNAARPLAVVTGARRGIGAAIAVRLAAEGFDLALTDRSAEGSDTVLAQAEAHGARARLFVSDLGDVATHAAVLQEITTWGGPVACLVNNAGVPAPRRGDLLELAPEAFDQVLDVNLRGSFFWTQAIARQMSVTPSDQARTIVTVSSVSAEMASIERGEYCLSKAGLAMMTKLFALRLAPLGIAVFELRPGIIRTPMTEAVAAAYDERIAAGLVPMQRWGTPEDVAAAVGALASGRFGFSTGSVITVDGALSLPRL